LAEGEVDGALEGARVGDTVGALDGAVDGDWLGIEVGDWEGLADGDWLGLEVGPLDGELVGSKEGEEVGSFVTTGAGVVGDNVGAMLDDERVGIDVVGCDEG